MKVGIQKLSDFWVGVPILELSQLRLGLDGELRTVFPPEDIDEVDDPAAFLNERGGCRRPNQGVPCEIRGRGFEPIDHHVEKAWPGLGPAGFGLKAEIKLMSKALLDLRLHKSLRGISATKSGQKSETEFGVGFLDLLQNQLAKIPILPIDVLKALLGEGAGLRSFSRESSQQVCPKSIVEGYRKIVIRE